MANTLKARLPKLPMIVDIAQDGSKAVLLFQQKSPHLIISDDNLPILSGIELLRDVRKTDGSVTFFILSSHDLTYEEPGLSTIKLPIADWTQFIGQVTASIPEDIKSRYGLAYVNSDLRKKLESYAQSLQSGQAAQTGSSLPLLLIPRYFDEASQSNEIGQVQSETLTPKTSDQVQTGIEGRRILLENGISLVLLLGMLATSGALIHWMPQPSWDKGAHTFLPTIFVFLTGMAFVAFFLGKIWEFWANRKGLEGTKNQ